jgi:eukaryotic-like serine/threonine-protein kinase
LYVSLVGRGKPVRLTNREDAADSNPAWSPDGQTVSFTRRVGGRGEVASLYLIPALGGVERRLDVTGSNPATWSADGKWLYFSTPVSPQKDAIFIESSLGGEKRRLTDPPPGFSDLFPSLSPDGRQIAFVRQQDVYSGDLYVCDLRDGQSAGPARRLTSDSRTTLSPAWTGDGREIVYVAGVGGAGGGGLTAIYRVPSSGGATQRLGGVGDYAVWVSTAPKANRLVYARSYADHNLYRMELPANGKPAGAPEKFLSSTRREATPSFSPDGKRIAFWSNRSGTENIWVAEADGQNPVQLTSFTSGVAGTPQWSPDGKTIVFDARPEGQSDIYSIPADGGAPKRLTNHPESDSVPGFSADGRWIFYQGRRSGEAHLFRIPAGGGEPVQMTQGSGQDPAASPDGKWIYFARGRSLCKIPPDGGQEIEVLPRGSLIAQASFTVRASGIYFVGPPDGDARTFPLRLLRFADGKTVELARLDRQPWLEFSVSPDEKRLLFTRLDSSINEIMLVEDFR